MNSLKKIAAISATIFAIALILTIILTPFAVSSAIDCYNQLIDKAEASADAYFIHTDLDSKIKDLTIEYSGYYGTIVIEESPDKAIHILNQDTGFNYIVPEIQNKGDHAFVNFLWHNDPRINEENILQFIAAEILENYRRRTVIQLPADASLHLSSEYMGDLYYNINFEYTEFANYEELSKEMDDWVAAHEAKQHYIDYIDVVNDQLREIQDLRYNLADSANSFQNAEDFQASSAPQYVSIKDLRSDLLKRSYNFRKKYGTQAPEELDASYLEYSRMIEELCAAEKDYDLMTAKVNEARFKLEYDQMSEQQFTMISDQCFSRQVELDLTISTLRDKLENYLRADIFEIEESAPVIYDENGAPMVPATDTPPIETPVPVTETETIVPPVNP